MSRSSVLLLRPCFEDRGCLCRLECVGCALGDHIVATATSLSPTPDLPCGHPSCVNTNSISFELCRQTSIYPRQYLLQGRKELLPPALGALVGLLLIRPEARLLHAQVGPCARRGESPSDDTLETIGRPRVRQRFVRLDCQDLTVDSAPVGAKIETVVHDRLEVVLHEPLLDQGWLRERAPDLFRRMRQLPFDDERTGGFRFGHWSILFKSDSRRSSRSCQK